MTINGSSNGSSNGSHRPSRGRSTAPPRITPRQAAEHFSKLGFNITAIPEGSKKPSHDWDNPDAPWGSERQPPEFIDSIKWPSKSVLYNGKWYRAIYTVGLICGISSLRGIDIDAVKGADGSKIAVPESVRDAILTALGLDPSYPWVGRSSSGTGWHILFRCDGELPADLIQAVSDRKAADGAGTGVKIGLPTAAFAGTFAQLELRWAHCQMALPSPTGYTGTLPDEPPALVSVEAVVAAFTAVAVPKPTSKHAKSVEKDRDIRETRSVGKQHTRIDLDRAIADLDLAFTGDQIVRWFVSELGGEPVPESQDQTRILGNGGLLVRDDSRWFAHGDEIESAARRAERLAWLARPLLIAVISVSALHIFGQVARFAPPTVSALDLPALAYHGTAAAHTLAVDLVALWLVAAGGALRLAGAPTPRAALAYTLGLTFLLNVESTAHVIVGSSRHHIVGDLARSNDQKQDQITCVGCVV